MIPTSCYIECNYVHMKFYIIVRELHFILYKRCDSYLKEVKWKKRWKRLRGGNDIWLCVFTVMLLSDMHDI